MKLSRTIHDSSRSLEVPPSRSDKASQEHSCYRHYQRWPPSRMPPVPCCSPEGRPDHSDSAHHPESRVPPAQPAALSLPRIVSQQPVGPLPFCVLLPLPGARALRQLSSQQPLAALVGVSPRLRLCAGLEPPHRPFFSWPLQIRHLRAALH